MEGTNPKESKKLGKQVPTRDITGKEKEVMAKVHSWNARRL